ncbi:hypothetical protein ACHAWO_011215 [Cyclotella atomus]|uniref:Autophagy-related protein 101 n=1 Tax=Cyclotella atomus TaxID=382360 RepID=A0ABD3NTX8_9STRA
MGSTASFFKIIVLKLVTQSCLSCIVAHHRRRFSMSAIEEAEQESSLESGQTWREVWTLQMIFESHRIKTAGKCWFLKRIFDCDPAMKPLPPEIELPFSSEDIQVLSVPCKQLKQCCSFSELNSE